MSSFVTERSCLIRLINSALDCFVDVLTYMSSEDLATISTTCKALYIALQDETVWWVLCRCRIRGLSKMDDQSIDSLRQLLFAPGFQQLYKSLHKLCYPFFGWHRLVPRSHHFCTGGLYHVGTHEGNIVCWRTDEHGVRAWDDRTFIVRYSTEDRGLQAISWTERMVYPLRITENSLIFEHTMMIPTEMVNFSPLPSFRGLNIQKRWEDFLDFTPCIGLYAARYGSHGTEILHLSLHSSADVSSLPPVGDINFGDLQIHGLKITGDPNVPANQLSFCINARSLVDANVAFLQDSRPIIVFPPDQHNPIMVSWQQRLPSMKLWARGYGQINRNPPVWSPEWVRCGFILYRAPLEENGAVFSILWDDETDFFRHAMDFRAVPTTSTIAAFSQA